MSPLLYSAPLVSIAVAGGYALIGDSAIVAILLFFIAGPVYVVVGLLGACLMSKMSSHQDQER